MLELNEYNIKDNIKENLTMYVLLLKGLYPICSVASERK